MVSALSVKPRPGRVLFPMGLAVCLSLYGDLTLYAVLVTQLDVVGLSLGAVGVMLSVNRLVRIPANPLSGALLDRWGRRRLFLLGMALGVLTTAGYGLVRGFGPFLVTRLTWGLAWTLINLGGISMVLDISTPATRGRLTGIYTTWQRLGFALAPLLGGFLVDRIGFRPAMLAGAGLTAVGLLVAAVVLPETAPARRTRPARTAGNPGVPRWRPALERARRQLRQNPDLLTASLLFMLILFSGEGVVLSTVSVLLQQRFGEQVVVGKLTAGVASAAGLMLGGRALLVSATGPVAGYLSDVRFGRRPVIAGSLLVGMVGLGLLFVAADLPAIVLGVALGALGAGAALAVLTAWVGDMVPSGRQGMAMGLYATMGDLGSMAGPALAFALLSIADVRWVYLVCVAFFVVGLALVWRGRKSAG